MVKLPRPLDFVDNLQLPPPEIMEELGRISVVSAGIEDILHGIWWRFTKIGEVVGPIITEDMKPSRIADDLLKIGRAAEVSEAQLEDLGDIFSQYRDTAADRNQFIHWIWHPREDGNHVLVPPGYKAKAVERVVTLEMVKAVANLLVWIETRLQAHYMTIADIKDARAEFGLKANMYVPTPWLDNNLQPIVRR